MAKLFGVKAMMKEPVLDDKKKPAFFKKAGAKAMPKGSSMLNRLTGK